MYKIKAWVKPEDSFIDIMEPMFRLTLTYPQMEFFAVRILEAATLTNLPFPISAIFQIQGTIASQLHLFSLRDQEYSITDSCEKNPLSVLISFISWAVLYI